MGLIEKYIETVSPAVKTADEQFPGPKDFVHLHNHTIFSPLDGVAQPEDYFSGCEYFGLPAFAITDHGTMASIPDAFFAAKKHKVKQIVGCEFYFNDFHHQVKEMFDTGVSTVATLKIENPGLWDRYRRNRHLTVLAKNMVGYRNLIHMSGEAWEKSFYYKPRINFDMLERHKDGLIIVSGCLNGPVCHELRMAMRAEKADPPDQNKKKEHLAKAMEYVRRFQDLFGDDYFLEFQMHGDAPIEFARDVVRQLFLIHKATGIRGVFTNDCHYLTQQDFQLQKVMMSIDQGMTTNDPNLFHVNCDEQFFKTRSQLRRTFRLHKYDEIMPPEKFEEFCDNTIAIHEKCSGFKPDLSPKLPSVPDADRELTKRVVAALKKTGLWDNPKQYPCDGRMVTHKEQAMIELQRITEKQFSSYFLIMQDLVNFSNSIGMPVGPGRGSAGGSLASFALGIHQMNPLLWELSFSRFLSESRGGNLLNVTMTD